jgi:UMF1 family MFS transporter
MDDYKNKFKPVFGWVMYDFANTIFAAVMVSFFFTRYLHDLTGCDVYTGLGNVLSMALAGLAVPVLGVLADRTGGAKRCLLVLTAICCAATALVSALPESASNVAWMVLLFIVANFVYQASLVFYNTLLADVATRDRAGLISGIGVGVGYIGTVFALLVLYPVAKSLGLRYTFAFCALMFAVFTIPIMLFVRERKVANPERFSATLLRSSFREFFRTLKKLPQDRPVLFFLIGNFLCVDALNSVIIFARLTIEGFFPEYKSDENQFSLMLIIIGVNSGALVAGLVIGRLTDAFGAKRMYLVAAGCFVAALAICSITAGASEAVFLTAFIGLGAIGLAGIWTAGRKMLLDLAPPDKIGEYFGLYGVTNKLSTLSALAFALAHDLSGGYRASLIVLAVFLVPGIILIFLVRPGK